MSVLPPTTIESSTAVLRAIPPDSWVPCAHCGDVIEPADEHADLMVTCTAFDDGIWTRLHHYHESCYGPADSPNGPVTL